jgi:cell wall-associated NlpC family hydrolase
MTPAIEVNSNHPVQGSSVRTSLRSDRAHRRVAALVSAMTIAIATALVWALASAVPSSAKPELAAVPSVDRLAGSDVGLHPRVRHVDAAAMSTRIKALTLAQRQALPAGMRAEVMRVARKQLGDPYRAGSAGPNAFDCGGFTQFVFRRALGMEIARTSRGQYQQVERIRKKEALPGDLVFFFEGGAHHVGIYLGSGRMIDAPNPRETVSVNPISGFWWGRSFTGFGRILPA